MNIFSLILLLYSSDHKRDNDLKIKKKKDHEANLVKWDLVFISDNSHFSCRSMTYHTTQQKLYNLIRIQFSWG